MGSKKTFDIPTQKDIEKNETIRDLTNTLQKGLQKQDERFKDIPTPVNFAKLETDVKHHGNLIYGMLIGVVAMLIAVTISLIGGYFHFDSKITTETKVMSDRYQHLEDKVNGDIKTMNGRVDSIIIPERSKQGENFKPENQGAEKGAN